MNHNFKILLIALSVCVFNIMYGQQPVEKNDTAYIFLIRGTLSNKRPVVDYLICFRSDSLINIESDNRDTFMCKVFNRLCLFEEPFFSLHNNIKLYFPDNIVDKDFLNNLALDIKKMNKKFSNVGTRKFKQDTDVSIQCVKIIGNFLKIEKYKRPINNNNHKFEIQEVCYNKNFIYSIKDILGSYKLDKQELLRWRRFFWIK